MKLTELQYNYPEDLVATEPRYPCRVLWQDTEGTREISWNQLLESIPPGDIVVLNDTQVLRRRIFSGNLEILFLQALDDSRKRWQVLFPSRTWKVGDKAPLPSIDQETLEFTLIEKGRPQVIEVSRPLDEKYFEQQGELPLPPYIQKARAERHNREEDRSWYQTPWAEQPGSFAAPTASLHFQDGDLEILKRRGVLVEKVTLHVGLGTFLPVSVEDLDDHEMHEEAYSISESTWKNLIEARARGKKIWALGTTVTRALETAAISKERQGLSRLLIQPGYQFQMVDRLMTNFHWPESTLLALVAAFAGLNNVRKAYAWAVEKKFRLFSYGDLSVWMRE